jgi:hypothetical protein
MYMRNRVGIVLSVAALLFSSMARAQEQQSVQHSAPHVMPGMDMSSHDQSGKPSHDMSNMKDMDNDSSAGAMHSMEDRMEMGPHMKMTALR